MQVHPVRDLVDDDVVADQQPVHRAVQPDPDLGVVQVQPADRRTTTDRTADAVHLIGVDPVPYVALDREVGQMHTRAATVRGVLPVEPRRRVHRLVRCRRSQRQHRTLDDRPPVPGALDRHLVDDDVPVHLERPGRNEHRPADPLSGSDGPVDRRRGIPPTRRISTEEPDVQRPSRRPLRRSDQLEVGNVQHVPGRRRVPRDLEPHPIARAIGLPEQQPLLVVEVVRPERLGHRVRLRLPPARVRVDIRVVGERVHPVQPGVLRGQRHRLLAFAVDRHVERRAQTAAVRGVRDAVAQRQRVRGPRERELDVLATLGQPYGGPPGSLGGQCVGLTAGADPLAVGVGVLGFLLDERDGRTAALDERRDRVRRESRGARGAQSSRGGQSRAGQQSADHDAGHRQAATEPRVVGQGNPLGRWCPDSTAVRRIVARSRQQKEISRQAEPPRSREQSQWETVRR